MQSFVSKNQTTKMAYFLTSFIIFAVLFSVQKCLSVPPGGGILMETTTPESDNFPYCTLANDGSGCVLDKANASDYQCLKGTLETDASLICFDETLNILAESFDPFMIDAAAHRGDPIENFRLSIRDVHLLTREHYAKFIEAVGKNIYPLIVATDSDTPELSGTGGVYKVYFRNGTMRRIVPLSTPDFEIYKCLSHIVLGIYAIIAPYFRSPKSINWKPNLEVFSKKLEAVSFVLDESRHLDKEAAEMINISQKYIANVLKNQNVNHKEFKKFANEMAPYIDNSLTASAKVHVEAVLPALQQLKQDMGEVLWNLTYVVIPTMWPVSLYNLRVQMFAQVMDFKQMKQQVLITEGAKNEDEARTTLGRIVGDRALAQLTFGGMSRESMKDHLFSFSTRRELTCSLEEDAIKEWCSQPDTTAKPGMQTKSRCPMAKAYATMLKHAA